MSIEKSLERIADALERLAVQGPASSVSVTTTGDQTVSLTPATPDPAPAPKKKATRKKTATPAPSVTPEAPAQPEAPAEAEVTKEDLSGALKAYLVKNPGQDGAEKARKIFADAGAVNITSLEPAKYKEVFLAIQELAKG